MTTSSLSLGLYALAAVCAAALVTFWAVANRARRNAGFATRSQLKRHLSARTVLKATEIRPSLSSGGDRPARASAVSLAKDRANGS
ncbi:hypothetical protein [Streptomyces sp. NPDC087294]|uniref:hypothetical protein n=1 Tax=Streptomyces sp. NPDC087294 TaxID=3365777 RepID=UPI003821ECD6